MKQNLIEWINNPNVAETLDDDTLMKIGKEVARGHEEDEGTMKDWVDLLKSGCEIMKPDNKSKDYPWEKAANYKSPIIGEAVRGFGDRMAVEILSKPDLVAAEVVGDSEQDSQDIEAAVDRVLEYQNYQINHEMKSWREEHRALGYRLAAQGALFKKTYFDPAQGHNVSEVIGYPNFSVNNKTTSMCDCNRFTHIKMYTPNEIVERQNYGVWLDVDIMPETDMATNSYNEDDDSEYKFLEQFCWYDLDDDGYAEPYIVTVHQSTMKVVRIVPRWNREGLMVKHDDSIMSLKDMQDRLSTMEMSEFETQEMYLERVSDTLKDAVSNAKLVKIEPYEMLTKYGFIDPADGTFLNYGFVHFMLNPVKAINQTSNSLFNSADLSNLQGGLLSKEHRERKRGNRVIKQGQWNITNIDAINLQNSILPFPNKEPSQTLLSLSEGLKAETKDIGTKVNLQDMMSPNIPAASVLGMMQEGIIPTTALIGSVVDSMSKEFQILYKLNKTYTDPETYRMVNRGQGEFEQDYALNLLIKPTANSKHSSQFQKIQLAQVQLEQVPLFLQAGLNVIPILKNYMEAIDSDIIDKVFSNEVPPEEQARLDEMKRVQEEQLAVAKQQTELLQAQVQQSQQDLDRKEKELNAKIQSMNEEQERKNMETEAKIQQIVNDMSAQQLEDMKKIQESKKLDAETMAILDGIGQKTTDSVIKMVSLIKPRAN